MIRRFRFPTLLALVVGLIALGIVSSGSAASAAGSARTDVIIGFNGQPGAGQPGAAEQALVRRGGGAIKDNHHPVPAIDAELDNSWGVKRIDAGTVHAGGNKGTGIKVAIIDSGVDYNHPDLNANFYL